MQLIRTAVVVRPDPTKDSAQTFFEITSALSKVKESLRWDSVQDQSVLGVNGGGHLLVLVVEGDALLHLLDGALG